jgi:hypothetical protein
MRLAQTKEATREFVALLESHLATIHPDYKWSRHAKGIRHEYIREIGDGLYAIHSVLCMRGRYYHCFCLSEHLGHVGPTLYSPFTIGGRCDHNYSITRACHGDLGLSPVDPVTPFRMSDSHQFRTGADKIVRRCTSEAEARLLPFYQSVWKQTRPVLQEMLDYIAATPADRLASAAATYPGPQHELSCHMLEFQRLYGSLPTSQRQAFFAAIAVTIPEIIRDITTTATIP